MVVELRVLEEFILKGQLAQKQVKVHFIEFVFEVILFHLQVRGDNDIFTLLALEEVVQKCLHIPLKLRELAIRNQIPFRTDDQKRYRVLVVVFLVSRLVEEYSVNPFVQAVQGFQVAHVKEEQNSSKFLQLVRSVELNDIFADVFFSGEVPKFVDIFLRLRAKFDGFYIEILAVLLQKLLQVGRVFEDVNVTAKSLSGPHQAPVDIFIQKIRLSIALSLDEGGFSGVYIPDHQNLNHLHGIEIKRKFLGALWICTIFAHI